MVCGKKCICCIYNKTLRWNIYLPLIRSAAVPGFEQTRSCFSYHKHRFTLSAKDKEALCLYLGCLNMNRKIAERIWQRSANQKGSHFSARRKSWYTTANVLFEEFQNKIHCLCILKNIVTVIFLLINYVCSREFDWISQLFLKYSNIKLQFSFRFQLFYSLKDTDIYLYI